MFTRLRLSLLLAVVGVLGATGAHAVLTAPTAEAKSCKWVTVIPDPSTPWIQYHYCTTSRP